MALSRKMFYFVFTLSFILVQLLSECRAGIDYSQPFPGGGFAVCEPCRLGRGKCRKMCLEDEKVEGSCKLNFFCCQKRL
ncbi:beta-defensin 105-like [Otolemur garnettii]|uniref:beta-defensin 105-like n=1 Tax=Otolemur garnettii TaxID=30611 RepID=UPI000274282C|nr:beta-defensin 105-like [Otolemur garnettii]